MKIREFFIANKKRIIFAALAALIIALIIWTAWGNTALKLNKYTVSSENIPDAFSGYRIAHISDLHNTEMGKDNEKLIAMLKSAKPDIIAITGDLIDSRNTNIEIAIAFVKQAVKIAPTYYVAGNHEARISQYSEFVEKLDSAGVTVLQNERIELEKSGEYITLVGVNDPSFETEILMEDSNTIMKSNLQGLINEDDKYTLLLSHRPELFEIYVDCGANLVLSGHAHGGQFRLPFIGGILAPDQGFFPKYDWGLYTENDTNMIVSRGIGNSVFPFRFNNRPEVILIELRCGARYGK